MEGFLRGLPKAELHLHIEGTLEPELLFAMARRNHVALRFDSVESLRAAYRFTDLQSFLDLYYEGAGVLRTEEDFYELTCAYLARAAADGVRRAEIFFDPQTHTRRGIGFGTVVDGIGKALEEAPVRFGVSAGLIPCFLRDLPVAEAMSTLEEVLASGRRFVAVGLDSTEVGHPPSAFAEVFSKARDEGLRVVAHAGEEGPPEYVWEALDVLGAERIDHGVRCLEDAALVRRLAADGVPLTVCPLSNVRLGVVDRLEDHPLGRLLEAGVVVTVNSDDPAYFGGYVGDNYVQTEEALDLGGEVMVDLARNSLLASFLPWRDREGLLSVLGAYVADHREGISP